MVFPTVNLFPSSLIKDLFQVYSLYLAIIFGELHELSNHFALPDFSSASNLHPLIGPEIILASTIPVLALLLARRLPTLISRPSPANAGADGPLPKLISMISGADNHKRLREMEKQNQELRLALDLSDQPTSIHNADGRILMANLALGRLLGKGLGEIIGRHCFEVFHQTKGPVDNCPLRKSLGSRQAETALIEIPSDGVPRKVQCEPLFDERGQVVRTIHIVRDLTDDIRPMGTGDFTQICVRCNSIKDDCNKWYSLPKGVCSQCSKILLRNAH